jgi:hypothetical protein
MLAMDVNDGAGLLIKRDALKYIASMLAPTVDRSAPCEKRSPRIIA